MEKCLVMQNCYFDFSNQLSNQQFFEINELHKKSVWIVAQKKIWIDFDNNLSII